MSARHAPKQWKAAQTGEAVEADLPEDTGAQVHAVLQEMQTKGFLCDQRAAEAFVHSRASRMGTRRLVQELQHKGLDQDTVAAAVEGLQATELQRAQEVWQRKFGQAPTTPQERAKHMRFLAARGFSADVVYRVVSIK